MARGSRNRSPTFFNGNYHRSKCEPARGRGCVSLCLSVPCHMSGPWRLLAPSPFAPLGGSVQELGPGATIGPMETRVPWAGGNWVATLAPDKLRCLNFPREGPLLARRGSDPRQALPEESSGKHHLPRSVSFFMKKAENLLVRGNKCVLPRYSG